MKWWELMQKFSLRDVEAGEPEGAGEAPEEGAGDLSDQDPNQGGGAPARSGVPEDVLPEALRGRSAAEIKQAIAEAFSSSRNANSDVQALRQELEEIRSNLKPKEPPAPEKPLEELLYENPEEAIDQVIRKRYGSRFAGLEEQVGSTVFSTVRAELPDFDEVEDDVRGLLKQSNAPATRANILGAYKMVLGEKAMAERAQNTRRNANPEKPKPPKPEPKKAQISDLERDIARGMGLTDEDYINSRDNPMNVKVPT